MKNQKGITLIALIITIIVMLILVGVSVSVALNGGLFKTAQEAAKKTETARQEELTAGTILTEYYLAKANKETTATNIQEYVLEKNGLKIGDKVNYDETNNGAVTEITEEMEWRVLGVNEQGQIELISTELASETVLVEGKEGYLNVATILDTACSAYGTGEGAERARSLTVEDINKLAGYNPATDSDYPDYGTKYTYKYYNGSIYGIKSTDITDENRENITGWEGYGATEFYAPNWTITSADVGPYELENTDYGYMISEKITETTPDNMFWADIIIYGENYLNGGEQWINGTFVENGTTGANYGVGYISYGGGFYDNWVLYDVGSESRRRGLYSTCCCSKT